MASTLKLTLFQDEPSKLVMLGKDYDSCTVLSSNFLIDDGAMGFLVADRHENLQILSYNPGRRLLERRVRLTSSFPDIASFNGQKLLRKGDYHLGSNVLKLVRIAKRPFLRPNAVAPTRPHQHGCIYGILNIWRVGI